jgi:UDP-N-acetylmuramoyl-tripeptide--D-alanyl-D-alanine ligase
MISELYKAFLSSSGICTDTRKISSNKMFVSLNGPTFNGNDYAVSAIKGGCSFAIVDEDRPEFQDQENIFVVQNALIALQELANYHRNKLKIPFIALTGSNGKTTTKELIREALSSQYKCFATHGNLNNHIGVPLTLLEIKPDIEIVIVEMGANHVREIADLCKIAEPTFGLITNIGLAHLDGFGGVDGVYKGKKELFDYLINSKGTLFVNMDDEKVMVASNSVDGITYGKSPDAIYCGEGVLNEGFLKVSWKRADQDSYNHIQTSLTGIYNFSNVMAAVSVARYFGVSERKIRQSLENYIPTNNRSQVVVSDKSNTIIVDCYNANPSSMKAAIQNVAAMNHSHSVAILGDMMELGEATHLEHQSIIELCDELSISTVYLIGKHFAEADSSSNHRHFENVEIARQFIESNPINSSAILLKGSRSITLEKLIDVL